MLTKDVIKHFGSQILVARALGISRAAVSKWPKRVPQGSAYKIESITNGDLKVNPADYPSRTEESSSCVCA